MNIFTTNCSDKKEKHKLINSKQHIHNKHYVQLQQATKMAKLMYYLNYRFWQ